MGENTEEFISKKYSALLIWGWFRLSKIDTVQKTPQIFLNTQKSMPMVVSTTQPVVEGPKHRNLSNRI